MGDGRDIVDEAKKLDGLPPEILKQILKSVSDRDLKRLSQVSKYIATWAKEEKDDRRKKKAKAFNDAGGHADLKIAAAFEDEGHYLFSRSGIPVWTPLVDEFLNAQHLAPPPMSTFVPVKNAKATP